MKRILTKLFLKAVIATLKRAESASRAARSRAEKKLTGVTGGELIEITGEPGGIQTRDGRLKIRANGTCELTGRVTRSFIPQGGELPDGFSGVCPVVELKRSRGYLWDRART